MKCLPILLLFIFFSQYIICSSQVQLRCPVVRLNNGKFRIRARGRIIRFGCLDGFTLVGNKYSTCVRGQWDTPTPVCVSTGCPAPPTPANSFMAPKVNGSILVFFCNPGYSLIGSSEVYCNGREWNGTIPYCRDTNVAPPISCDFETPDLCWWEQDPLHDFDWKRHNFETPSLHIGTGPTHDHTLGPGNDGHYLYIEASGRLMNDTARIVSPLYNFSLSELGCFSFWYHMYGATIGYLNIYFKPEDSAQQLMFSKHGNQGNQWFRGIFELPKTEMSFQIIIEGVRGASYVSDIAVDDVAILIGDECHVKTESTSVTANDYDQVELVNSLQSCRDRCFFTMTESTASFDARAGPESCFCTFDCLERSMCCPDYAEYCLLGFSGQDTLMPDGIASYRPTPSNLPVKNFTLTFPINPKDDIDPGMPNATTTSTPTRSTITMTTKTTTQAPTKAPSPLPTTVKPTLETKETPFETTKTTSTTTKPTQLYNRSDQHDTEKVGHGRGFGIIAGVIATLAVLSIGLVAVVVIRRRRIYTRGTSNSAEDSDVRYLTSDEVLDFNLARPDNEEL